MRQTRVVTAVAALVLLAVSLTPATARQQCGDAEVDALFDQKAPDATQRLRLRDGQEFRVGVMNGDETNFQYSIAGIAAPVSTSVGTRGAGAPCVALPSHRHDKRFAGYFITAQHRNAQSGNSVTMMLFVDTPSWQSEFAGAFAVSDFSDPVYGLETVKQGEQEVQVLREDTQARDAARLGLAAQVHVYHDRLPWLAATFGLGINDNNRSTYYIGPSIRLSDRLAFTGGRAWSSIKRLPAGVAVGQPVADVNVLGNMQDRIVDRWFFSLAYTFFNPGGNQLAEAFAGQKESPTPDTKESASSSPAGEAAVTVDADVIRSLPSISPALRQSGVFEMPASADASAGPGTPVEIVFASDSEYPPIAATLGPGVDAATPCFLAVSEAGRVQEPQCTVDLVTLPPGLTLATVKSIRIARR